MGMRCSSKWNRKEAHVIQATGRASIADMSMARGVLMMRKFSILYIPMHSGIYRKSVIRGSEYGSIQECLLR